MLISRCVICLLPLVAALASHAGTPAPLPPFTPWDMKALARVPSPEWVDKAGSVRALLYEGEPYKGRKTKVFAYYASPHTLGIERDPAKKFPGIVLVHGADGQAFGQWVQAYARRGYAAIAMDLAGNWQPTPQGAPVRHPDGGPPQDDATKFRMPDVPDGDQWMYHAVADVVLANSLMHTIPEVDASRIGITGIGWGGTLTCIAAGLDPRFKAALPMFGCGFLEQNSFWTATQFKAMSPEWRKKWTQLWDPASYIGSAQMPVFFVTGTNDPFYPLDSLAKTCALVQSPKNMCALPQLKHGNIFDSPLSFGYFGAMLMGGPPLPRVASMKAVGDKFTAEVQSPGALKSAMLHYTSGAHTDNKTRTWMTHPLSIDGQILRGTSAPSFATAWFVLVEDDNNVVVSSEVVTQ